MRLVPCMLADDQVADVLAQWRTLSAGMRERLIFIAAVTSVSAVVIIWAVFFRRKRRRRRERSRGHDHSQGLAKVETAAESDGDPSAPVKRRRWRRLRREHRPRNPTLSETGGLPPVRTEGPPDIHP